MMELKVRGVLFGSFFMLSNLYQLDYTTKLVWHERIYNEEAFAKTRLKIRLSMFWLWL